VQEPPAEVEGQRLVEREGEGRAVAFDPSGLAPVGTNHLGQRKSDAGQREEVAADGLLR
jgi:hypothetical protein